MKTIDRTAAPAVHDITEVRLPQQSSQTLSNGVSLNILDRPDMEVVRLSMVWDDGKSTRESALALPVMSALLTEGAGDYSAEQLNDMLDYHGTWFNCVSDVHYTTATMAAVSDAAPEMMPVMAAMVSKPLFETGAFAPVRDRIAAQADIALTRVVTHALNSNNRLIFGPGHVSSQSVAGADYTALGREDIIEVHRNIMLSHRPTFYLSGRVTDETLRAIDGTLGMIDFGDSAPAAAGSLSPGDCHHIVTHHPDTLQAAIVMSMPVIGREHPDYIPLRLTAMALGGYFGARLMSNIREDKGYTYGITAALMGFREGGVVTVRTEADCSYAEPLIAEVLSEIERLATEPPAGVELETLRRYAMSMLLSTVDNAFSISDYYMQHQTLRTPDDYMERQIEAINSLTPSVIASMASKYLAGKEWYTSIATK